MQNETGLPVVQLENSVHATCEHVQKSSVSRSNSLSLIFHRFLPVSYKTTAHVNRHYLRHVSVLLDLAIDPPKRLLSLCL